MYITTIRWEAISSAALRALYGADCYAYALVASGFGADLVIEVFGVAFAEPILKGIIHMCRPTLASMTTARSYR